MSPKPMPKQPIAQRIVSIDGRDVRCTFFAPELDPEPDGEDYCCRYDIDWPSGLQSREIYGADGVQALLLALQVAHNDLLGARANGQDVRWLDMQDLGLPPPDWTSASEP